MGTKGQYRPLAYLSSLQHAQSIEKISECQIRDFATPQPFHAQIDCKVISVAIESDHVHLFLNYDPDLSIAQIMHRIKGASSFALRTEFPALKNAVYVD